MGKKKGKRRKQQLCRICKKNPVWRGGDVKEPGPYCKRCYHKHVWAGRPAARKARKERQSPPEPEHDFDHCPQCGVEADVASGGMCPNCRFCFDNALYAWLVL